MAQYHHLSYEERVELAVLRRQGVSMRRIARILGRSSNTISRELREKRVKGRYAPKKAQHKTYWRRYRSKRDCMKVAINGWLSHTVPEKLRMGWSPERIAGWCTKEGHPVSKSSVYRYVDSRCLERYLFSRKYPRKGGKRRHRSGVAHDGRKFIDVRPPFRNESGHYEADFIVSGENAASLLVIVDRYTRRVRIKKLPNRKHALIVRAFCEMFEGIRVKTLTLDNDVSFARWRELEHTLKTAIYFTHPYHSWEKGLVENTNRWVRLFVPKRTDVAGVSDDTLSSAEQYLNETPRQCLNYRTAAEMAAANP